MTFQWFGIEEVSAKVLSKGGRIRLTELVDLVLRGERIKAIKMLRDEFEIGLLESKRAVDLMVERTYWADFTHMTVAHKQYDLVADYYAGILMMMYKMYKLRCASPITKDSPVSDPQPSVLFEQVLQNRVHTLTTRLEVLQHQLEHHEDLYEGLDDRVKLLETDRNKITNYGVYEVDDLARRVKTLEDEAQRYEIKAALERVDALLKALRTI